MFLKCVGLRHDCVNCRGYYVEMTLQANIVSLQDDTEPVCMIKNGQLMGVKYSRIPLCQTSQGNKNWFEKSEVGEIKRE